MGRPNRFLLPGMPQLLRQRGHNRLPCFLEGADYEYFMETLRTSAEMAETSIHAAVLLPHAYWVLARPGTPDGIGRMIQRTGRCYVRFCNRKYRREGTLWAGRYQACLVEPSDEAMGNCLQYLRETPERSGLTAAGTPWPWSYFDEDLPAVSASPLDADGYRHVTTVLRMGLVLGSNAFCEKVATESGLKTTPGVRGRPRKSH